MKTLDRYLEGFVANTAVITPEGWWVLRSMESSESDLRLARIGQAAVVIRRTLVGPDTARVLKADGQKLMTGVEVVYSSPSPFGLLTERLTSSRELVLAQFDWPRQIVMGKCIHSPPAPFAPIVYAQPTRKRTHGWVRLADVARIVGLSPRDVLERWQPFLADQGTNSAMFVVARSAEMIENRDTSALEQDYRLSKLHRVRVWSDRRLEQLWIRRSKAKQICIMYALGCIPKPVAMQYAA